MKNIELPSQPEVGDLVEVLSIDNHNWEPAIITKIVNERIMGELIGSKTPSYFSYTFASYRQCWRYK